MSGDRRPVCDGCGVELVWVNSSFAWEHIQGTRCSHFDTRPPLLPSGPQQQDKP